MVPILPYICTGNFLLLLLYLGCTTYQRSIPFGYLLHMPVQGPLLCFLETRGQEIPQWPMYRHSWRRFLGLSLRSACFIDRTFFLVKSKTSSLGNTFLKCRIIRISRLLDAGLKEFAVYSLAVLYTH
jgi:hypothetical protein